MDKPSRYLFDSVIFVITFLICAPMAVVAYQRELYGVMYGNAMGSLLSILLFLVNICCFVKSLVVQRRKRGE